MDTRHPDSMQDRICRRSRKIDSDQPATPSNAIDGFVDDNDGHVEAKDQGEGGEDRGKQRKRNTTHLRDGNNNNEDLVIRGSWL